MFLDEYNESPILGASQCLSGQGKKNLLLLVNKAPLSVFQALNKKLNEKGLLIHIEKLRVP